MKLKNNRDSMIAAWVAWAKARHGWDAIFAKHQAELYMHGTRGVELHDVTCVVFEKYFFPLYEC